MTSETSTRLSWGWRGVYAMAIVFIGLRLLSLGAGNNFFYDEWQFVTERRSLTAEALFVPHNGHLSTIPVAVFMLLLRVAGLSHYGAFRLAVLAVHLVVALLAATLVRRRFGELWGLSVLVVVGLMGAGWQNVFWGFQFAYVSSIACMLGVLLVLDDDARMPSRRGAATASALVTVSLLSSGVGVPVLVAVSWLCLAGRRRRELWWVPVAPAVMYGLWYLTYGTSSVDWSAMGSMLDYSGRSVSAAMGGVFGLGERTGQVLAGVLIVVLGAHLVRRRATIRSSTPLVFYAVFLGLLALSRSSSPEPDASRYLYVGIVAMIAAAACAGGPLLPNRSRSRIGTLALTVVAVWGSNAALEDGAHWLRNQGDIMGAELAVVEAHRDSLDSIDVVDPVHAPGLTVGGYLAAVDDLGSSAAVQLSSIPTMRLSARTGADLIVNRLVTPESTGYLDEDCEVTQLAVTTLVVQPGESATVSGYGPGTFLVNRFALEESRLDPRELDIAVVRLAVPSDESPVPYTITFAPAVDVVDCA